MNFFYRFPTTFALDETWYPGRSMMSKCRASSSGIFIAEYFQNVFQKIPPGYATPQLIRTYLCAHPLICDIFHQALIHTTLSRLNVVAECFPIVSTCEEKRPAKRNSYRRPYCTCRKGQGNNDNQSSAEVITFGHSSLYERKTFSRSKTPYAKQRDIWH